MTDLNKIDKLSCQYDNKKITYTDNNGEKKEVKLSVFSEDMTITADVKDAMGHFNIRKDHKLDKEEVAIFKKVINDYAGADKTLDDNEILQIFGLTAGTPEADKTLKQFKTVLERQTTGSTTTTQEDESGNKITSTFNADGSGTVIKTGKDKQGNPYSETLTYNKGGILAKRVTTNSVGTITSEYTSNENGQPVTINTTMTDKSGKVVSTSVAKYTYEDNKKKTSEVVVKDSKGTKTTKETYTYNEQGLMTKKEGIVTGPKVFQLPNGTTIPEQHNYSVENEYNSDGKVTKTVRKEGSGNINGKTVTILYNENGKISRQETAEQKLVFYKDSDGKMKVRKEQVLRTIDYTYHENGNKAQVVMHNVDSTGKPSDSTIQYAQDGKTIVAQDKVFYKRGAKIEDHYEGANINNRVDLPSQRTEYEEDGITIKQKTINKFDDNGILIGREVYDKDGKLIKSYDFSTVDGNFEISNQIGRGDCYFLSAINSLAESEDGHKLLQQNLKIEKDSNGNNVYTISFPGASKTREALLKANGIKVDESKIYFQDSYSITEAELKEAAKKAGIRYSAGDKDVLLLEVAFEKYRKDIFKTRQANNIPATFALQGFGTFDSKCIAQGDYLSNGQPADAMYAMTAIPSEVYSAKNTPVCYVDSDLNMHLTDENGNIIDGQTKAAPSTQEEKDASARITKLLNELEQDSADGKIDNFAATVGIRVSTQEVNGHCIKGGGHALTVLKVTADTVTLSNPWSPDTYITMPRKDFEMAALSLTVTPINQAGVQAAAQSGQQAQGPESPQNPSAPANKPNFTVPKGKGYITLIREELKKQGIPLTRENIRKAQEQFEQANPGQVKISKTTGNKYLYAYAKIYIPQFKMD